MEDARHFIRWKNKDNFIVEKLVLSHDELKSYDEENVATSLLVGPANLILIINGGVTDPLSLQVVKIVWEDLHFWNNPDSDTIKVARETSTNYQELTQKAWGEISSPGPDKIMDKAMSSELPGLPKSIAFDDIKDFIIDAIPTTFLGIEPPLLSTGQNRIKFEFGVTGEVSPPHPQAKKAGLKLKGGGKAAAIYNFTTNVWTFQKQIDVELAIGVSSPDGKYKVDVGGGFRASRAFKIDIPDMTNIEEKNEPTVTLKWEVSPFGGKIGAKFTIKEVARALNIPIPLVDGSFQGGIDSGIVLRYVVKDFLVSEFIEIAREIVGDPQEIDFYDAIKIYFYEDGLFADSLLERMGEQARLVAESLLRSDSKPITMEFSLKLGDELVKAGPMFVIEYSKRQEGPLSWPQSAVPKISFNEAAERWGEIFSNYPFSNITLYTYKSPIISKELPSELTSKEIENRLKTTPDGEVPVWTVYYRPSGSGYGVEDQLKVDVGNVDTPTGLEMYEIAQGNMPEGRVAVVIEVPNTQMLHPTGVDGRKPLADVASFWISLLRKNNTNTEVEIGNASVGLEEHLSKADLPEIFTTETWEDNYTHLSRELLSRGSFIDENAGPFQNNTIMPTWISTPPNSVNLGDRRDTLPFARLSKGRYVRNEGKSITHYHAPIRHRETAVQFDLDIRDAQDGDTLSVFADSSLLGDVDLGKIGITYGNIPITIPLNEPQLRGTQYPEITLELLADSTFDPGKYVTPSVDIDNVGTVGGYLGLTGDIIEIEVDELGHFNELPEFLFTLDGFGRDYSLETIETSKPGKLKVLSTLGPESSEDAVTIGEILLPEFFKQGEILETGKFYFVPSFEAPENPENLPDYLPGKAGSQIAMLGTVKYENGEEKTFRIAIGAGYSTEGPHEINKLPEKTGAPSIETIRLHQRLSYLGYPINGPDNASVWETLNSYLKVVGGSKEIKTESGMLKALNQPDAPRWVEPEVDQKVTIQSQNERFSSSYVSEIIETVKIAYADFVSGLEGQDPLVIRKLDSFELLSQEGLTGHQVDVALPTAADTEDFLNRTIYLMNRFADTESPQLYTSRIQINSSYYPDIESLFFERNGTLYRDIVIDAISDSQELEDHSLRVTLMPRYNPDYRAWTEATEDSGKALASVVDGIDRFHPEGPLGSELWPGGPSLSENVVTFTDGLRSYIVEPVETFLRFAGNPSPEELGAFLDSQDAIDYLGYGPSSDRDALIFDMSYDISQTSEPFPFPLSDLALGDGLSFETDIAASVTGSLNVLFSLGIDLRPERSFLERVFVNFDQFAFSVETNAAIDAGIQVGFLDAHITGGELNLLGGINVTLNDPDPEDGRLTLTELENTPLTELVTFDAFGTLYGELPVNASLGGFNFDQSAPKITITDNNIFDAALPDIEVQDFDKILNFNNMNAASFVGLLGQLRGWLDNFRDSSTLNNINIPFVKGTMGKVLDFADLLGDTLLYDDHNDDDPETGTPKLLDKDNAPTFQTAQELEQRLAAILDIPLYDPDPNDGVRQGVNLRYDPEEDFLALDLDLSSTFADLSLPADFSLNLAPLLDLSSDSSFEVTAEGGLSLTIGLYLGDAPTDSLIDIDTPVSHLDDAIGDAFQGTLALTVPAVYGRLSRDAVFKLVIAEDDGSYTEKTITIEKTATSDNRTVDDLVTSINLALNGAGIGTRIQAGANGERIILRSVDTSVTGFSVFADNELPAPEGTETIPNPAVHELGFREAILLTDAAYDEIDRFRIPGDWTGEIVEGIFVVLDSRSAEGDAAPSITRVTGVAYAPESETLVTVADGMVTADLRRVTLPVPSRSNDSGIPSVAAENELVEILPRAAFGRLDQPGDTNALFDLSIDSGAPVPVTVSRAITLDNLSVEDVVNDVNQALAASGLEASLLAEALGLRLILRAIDPSIGAFELKDPNTTAQDRYGLMAAHATLDNSGLSVMASTDMFPEAPDPVLEITIDGGAVTEAVLPAGSLATNRSILNLVSDMRSAIKTADLHHLIQVDSQGNRLVFKALAETVTTFTVRANNSAAELLGFAGSPESADKYDLVIVTRDGSRLHVALDGAVDLGDVIEIIIGNGIIDDIPKIDAYLNEAGTGLVLEDLTSGTRTFHVEMINGSPAALQLGILNSDAGNGNQASDGIIEGAPIGGISLLDRFFLENTNISAAIDISMPGGLNLAGKFGNLVTIAAEGGGWISAGMTTGLKDPKTGGDDGRISFSELVDNLDPETIDLLVDPPRFIKAPNEDSFGAFDLDLRLDPISDLIDLGADPGIDIEVLSLPFSENRFDVISVLEGNITLSGDQLRFLEIAADSDTFPTLTTPDGETYFVKTAALSDADTVITVDDPEGTFDTSISSVTITAPAQPVVDFTSRGLEDLDPFGNLDFNLSTIIDGLKALAGFLGQFEAFDFLSKEIPLIDVSVNDLLAYADRFDAFIQAFERNPAGSVQNLEVTLKEALGLSPDSNAVALSVVFEEGNPGSEDDTHILRMDFGLASNFSESLNMDLTIPGLEDHLSGAAGLKASGDLDLSLDLGIDLDDPSRFYLFDTTGISGSLHAAGDNLSFMAGLGPAGISITDGSASVDGFFNGGLLESPVFMDHRAQITFTDPDLPSSLLLDGIPFGNLFEADYGFAIDASLPLYFPTQSIFAGTIVLSHAFTQDSGAFIPSLEAFKFYDPEGDEVEGISSLIVIDHSQFDLLDQILMAVDGIDLFLMGLQNKLDGKVFGVTLPLIGDKLSDGARFIEDFRNGFLDDFRTGVETIGADENPVDKFLFEILGPGDGGLNLLLKDADNDGKADRDADDRLIKADSITDIGSGNTNADERIEWVMTIGDEYSLGADIGFDLGIPGLGLSTAGDIDATLQWELDFGFGISYAEGFYLLLSEDGAPELDVTLSVDLFDDLKQEPFALTGTLGFLQMTAADKDVDGDGDGTRLEGKFAVDIQSTETYEKDPGVTINILPFSGLGDIDFHYGMAAEASVELGLTLGVAGAGGFPSIVSDFVFRWAIGDPAGNTLVAIPEFDRSITDGLRKIAFEDVGLDLGSYISEVVGPLARRIQEITEPVQPLIDIVTTPLPVISDLGPKTTLLDLAKLSGYVDSSFIDALESIFGLISQVNSLSIPEDDVILPLGHFPIYDVDDDQLSGYLEGKGFGNIDLGSPDFDLGAFSNTLLEGPIDIANGFDSLDQLIADSDNPETAALVNGLVGEEDAADESGFTFPWLENPSLVFGALLGKPLTLIGYDMPPLEFNFEWSKFFSIFGPLGVTINAEFGFALDFAFGFDTTGIKQFVGGGFRNPKHVLNGLFVSDTDNVDGTGPDVPELTFDGGVWAAAELNMSAARGGVGGGIFAGVDFNLFDPDKDGLVYIGEMIGNIENQRKAPKDRYKAPLAIFDVSGIVTAELFAFLKIDLKFYKVKKKWQITPPVTLAEFDVDFYRPPILASELPNGDLVLNMGEFAEDRMLGDTRDDGEKFFAADAGAGKVDVWAPTLKTTGYGTLDRSQAQTYSIGKGGYPGTIIVAGGEGDDIIDLSEVGSGIRFDIDGGAGNDTIILGENAGRATIRGGFGGDTIISGQGDDVIFGGGGADLIYAGAGKDIVLGDVGRYEDGRVSAIAGMGDGDDTIWGEAGDDILIGGGGSDTVFGDNPGELSAGSDRDILIGDGGAVDTTSENRVDATQRDRSGFADFLFGNADADRIYGGRGDDSIDGGEGGDDLFGEAGFDTLNAGGGNDLIFGDNWRWNTATGQPVLAAGGEADVIFGDSGVDTIYAGGGNDIIHGGDDGDTVYAGTGADTVYGDSGDDRLYGESGPDEIFGNDNDGADELIDAGPGADIVRGGPGTETIYGGAGDDLIYALTDSAGGESSATHTISGGSENDTIYGDLGTDTIHGDSGNDLIHGLAGVDKLFGDDGRDTLYGGIDGDEIYGGWGQDIIFAGVNAAGDGSEVDVNTVYGDVESAEDMPGTPEDHKDEIYGDIGKDIIRGGSGGDVIRGNPGGDEIYGESGGDQVHGGSGADFIYGDDGDDTLFGGDHGDTIEGGGQNDLIVGNLGSDTLYGDTGSDVIWGGEALLGLESIRESLGATLVLPPLFATEAYRIDPEPKRIVPEAVSGASLPGDDGDGDDDLRGGDGNDYLFGGGDSDELYGGGGDDYVDGGSGNDTVRGSGGDDVVRGGANEDTVRGDAGLDQVYGDNGSDSLFGDAGADNGSLVGQRLWGGPGIDFLHAFAETSDVDTERVEQGDELHGGGGNDWLYGNLRQDILIGDGGNDFLHGDYLGGTIGDRYLLNPNAATHGADDTLIGSSGEDTLYGGGNDDELWGGPDSDRLEGQQGNDTLYGGGWNDMLVLDVRPEYFENLSDAVNETFDGYKGEGPGLAPGEDDATDILLIEGTSNDDTIRLSQVTVTPDEDLERLGDLKVVYNGRDILADWRDDAGTPLVEQFRVSGLMGDDIIEFVEGPEALDVTDLSERSNDWVGVIDGGSGNDLLLGTGARDSIDGGPGSDFLYGFGGDDRLWGDGGEGLTVDHDVLFAGRGNDDLIGGQGVNHLFSWSMDPYGPLHFMDGDRAEGVGEATLTAFAAVPRDGVLRRAAHFTLTVDGTTSQTVVIEEADTAGFSARDDLVDLLNPILTGIDVAAGVDDEGRLTFSRVNVDAGGHVSLQIHTGQFGVFTAPESDRLFDDNGDFVGALDEDGNPLPDGFLDGPGGEPLLDANNNRVPARQPENTGLNRMLGSDLEQPMRGDHLYGGTGLDFMYGNGGSDTLYWADGTRFEDKNGGLEEDAWKAYAKETGMVWYVGGTNADDVISVDYVTEPGLLAGRHLVTRLTENADNYSFAAQLDLDFDAVNESGDPVWDLEALAFDAAPDMADHLPTEDAVPNNSKNAAFDLGAVEELSAVRGLSLHEGTDEDWYTFTLSEEGTGEDAIVAQAFHLTAPIRVDLIDAADTILANVSVDAGQNRTEFGLAEAAPGSYWLRVSSEAEQEWASYGFDFSVAAAGTRVVDLSGAMVSEGSDLEKVKALLPPEGDFLAILVDALKGNDDISIGPTVQKTVWVDAGPGDDRVEIRSGNTILVDKTENSVNGARNDTWQSAYGLGSGGGSPALTANARYSGLTIDNPEDIDWYAFTLSEDPAATAHFTIVSESERDQLALRLYRLDPESGEAIFMNQTNFNGQSFLPIPDKGDQDELPNDTRADAFDLGPIENLGRVVGLTIHDDTDQDWFTFSLQESGTTLSVGKAESNTELIVELWDIDGVAALESARTAPDDSTATIGLDGYAPGDYRLRVRIADSGGWAHYSIDASTGDGEKSDQDLSGRGNGDLPLAGLTAGTPDTPEQYLLRVSSNKIPTIYSLEIILDTDDGAVFVTHDLSLRTDEVVRRDVILGGAGNDVLSGGPGEDWIFGGPGNDVLTGGMDRQATDLLFGEAGSDTFQLIPDRLPVVKGTNIAFSPTQSDLFRGGDGVDRVLFLGGDLDRYGEPVPDNVAVRYNTVLHRYEFTGLVWDVRNREFVSDGPHPAVLIASVELGSADLGGEARFSLVLDGNDEKSNIILPYAEEDGPAEERTIDHLIADLATALEDAGLAGKVIAGQQDGKITLSTVRKGSAASLEIVFPDTIDPEILAAYGVARDVLGFAVDDPEDALAVGVDRRFAQHYVFYRVQNVEQSVFDTRAGDDVVHADPGHTYEGSESEWGIDPGDLEQRALIAALEIYGGDGNDQLFGGGVQ